MTITIAGDSYRNVNYHVSRMEAGKLNFIFACHTFRSEITSFMGDTKFFARAPSYSAKYPVFRMKSDVFARNIRYISHENHIFRQRNFVFCIFMAIASNKFCISCKTRFPIGKPGTNVGVTLTCIAQMFNELYICIYRAETPNYYYIEKILFSDIFHDIEKYFSRTSGLGINFVRENILHMHTPRLTEGS